MNDYEFRPEYPGDNLNRAWVRQKMAEKNIPADMTEVVARLPQPHIDWMFAVIVSHY